MKILLNGESFECAEGATLLSVIAARGFAPERVAAEVDGAIVPRADFAETALRDGAKVEVVHFVGGG